VAKFCQPMVNKWQPFKFKPRLLKLSVKVFSKNLAIGHVFCKWLLAIKSLCFSISTGYYNESNAKLLATKCKMQ